MMMTPTQMKMMMRSSFSDLTHSTWLREYKASAAILKQTVIVNVRVILTFAIPALNENDDNFKYAVPQILRPQHCFLHRQLPWRQF